ncbi:SGNH/GDSL hydrolase family protein [Massilia sp. TS11]|uniref:SGNH/GDSL hydrolase family protein n=1 Tax=Massilia sp. TS11 TaxID=2908003 RepID=UPI001EDB3A81|nr:SGNH/GDSL hydrolase family protein [Massilia sp. TS11]MCG2586160.1 SGNH/GDSL hydrolase family protein [Massilia sp. TS11]
MELIAKLSLGPLLLAQGRRVRRTATRLPEPPGARAGETGAGPLLRLLVLGDSSAAGVGAPHQDAALCGQLVAALAAQRRVRWQLLARSGLDAAGIRALLPATADAVDVVVLCCGVNEVTSGAKAAHSVAQMAALLEDLRMRLGAPQVLLSPVPPMHLFPALPQPLRWFLGLRARKLDAAIRRALPQWPQARLVEHGVALSAQTIASDGFHPGPQGYAAWARVLAQTILRP